MTGPLAVQDWCSLMVANQLPGVTVVADAHDLRGQPESHRGGRPSFIFGMKPVADGLGNALHAPRRGLNADEAALVALEPDRTFTCRPTTKYRLIRN
jgi:hypothetical protein